MAARLKGQLPDLREALAIVAQVADALNEAHTRGVIHRDIKPENIMLTARAQVKVLDFGLAKLMNDSGDTGGTATMLSVPGMVIGTVPYMSPEQVRGEELDCRSDIFSFGIVLYELLSGRRPFEAKSTAEIMSAILTANPPPIERPSLSHTGGAAERLIRKCLEKDPSLRYQTTGDLIPDLQQIRRDSETGQVTPRAWEPTVKLTEATPPRKGADLAVQSLNLSSRASCWRWRQSYTCGHLGPLRPHLGQASCPPTRPRTMPTSVGR